MDDTHPIIHLKWAQTLDGQLLDDTGSSQWISGPEERHFTHSLRTEYDAIAVGAGTYVQDRAQLTIRRGFFRAGDRQPARVLVDPRGTLARFLGGLGEAARTEWVADLRAEARATLVIGEVGGLAPYAGAGLRLRAGNLAFEGEGFSAEFRRLIADLPRRTAGPGFRLQVEGGPRLLTQMIRVDLFDELHVSISSRITGGRANRLELLRSLKTAPEFDVLERRALGPDTFLRLRRTR